MALLFLQGKGYNHQNSWLCFCLCLNGPIKVIFQIGFWNCWKTKKIFFDSFDIKGSPLWKKIWKFEKIDFFQRKSNFLHLNMSSKHSKLSFEVHIRGFAQIFQIFTFLPTNFPSMTNFICWPLAANIVIKSDCFWYQWTAKDQNIYLWSIFTIHMVFQLHSKS